MNKLRDYVRSYGGSILYRIITGLGLGTAAANAAVSFFLSLMDSVIGDQVAIVLAPIIYLYNTLSNVDISLPNWIIDLYNFVTGVVRVNWAWLINTVEDLVSFFDDIGDFVRPYVYQILSAYDDALAWSDWLFSRFGNELSNFLQDPDGYIWRHLPNEVRDIYNYVNDLLGSLNDIVYNLYGALAQFIADPFGFVMDMFSPALKSAWITITSDMSYLVWLFGDGKRFIISLVADPTGTILALIENTILPWLEKVIAESW